VIVGGVLLGLAFVVSLRLRGTPPLRPAQDQPVVV
jgi:hypothetical protein